MRKNTEKLLAMLILVLFFVSCGSSTTKNKLTGLEGGPCYDNGLCKDNLTCISDICVNSEASDDNNAEDTEDADCIGQYEIKCCLNNICSYNSCGEEETTIEFCEYGCQNAECLPDPNIFWTDPVTGYNWSARSPDMMTYNDSIEYCWKLGNSWRLPTITEVRTLIQNCPDTETGGLCNINDNDCLGQCQNTNCTGCSWQVNGAYSKIGDGDVRFWSSSLHSNNSDFAWFVDFGLAKIYNETLEQYNIFHCIKR